MSQLIKIVWLIVILTIGVLLSLPFRHSDGDSGVKRKRGWQEAVMPQPRVFLNVNPEWQKSPASGLVSDVSKRSMQVTTHPSLAAANQTEDVTTPLPNLPRVFPFISADLTDRLALALRKSQSRNSQKEDELRWNNRLHKISDGDTLPKLADRYLKNPERWREIYAANQDVLQDHEILPLGVEIKIPIADSGGTINTSPWSTTRKHLGAQPEDVERIVDQLDPPVPKPTDSSRENQRQSASYQSP